MARNRQRAKQRQAARRAARLEERAERTKPKEPRGDGAAPAGKAQARPVETLESTGSTLERAELEASAPPEDAGRSDTVLESPPPAPELVEPEPDEAEWADEEEEEDEERTAPGRDREEREPARERGKVLTFLSNVVAELQRVQWPDRQGVTTLTAVVLGFVLIAGGYLGALDAVFSRVIEAIL